MNKLKIPTNWIPFSTVHIQSPEIQTELFSDGVLFIFMCTWWLSAGNIWCSFILCTLKLRVVTYENVLGTVIQRKKNISYDCFHQSWCVPDLCSSIQTIYIKQRISSYTHFNCDISHLKGTHCSRRGEDWSQMSHEGHLISWRAASLVASPKV